MRGSLLGRNWNRPREVVYTTAAAFVEIQCRTEEPERPNFCLNGGLSFTTKTRSFLVKNIESQFVQTNASVHLNGIQLSFASVELELDLKSDRAQLLRDIAGVRSLGWRGQASDRCIRNCRQLAQLAVR
jgi:hypothetical protein